MVIKTDWYETARAEFLQDLGDFNNVTREDAKRIYAYLAEIGLVDYDIEKEYLFDNYTD